MRRHLPTLLEHYGLKPWDLDRLWPSELDVLVADMNALYKARREANKRIKG